MRRARPWGGWTAAGAGVCGAFLKALFSLASSLHEAVKLYTLKLYTGGGRTNSHALKLPRTDSFCTSGSSAYVVYMYRRMYRGPSQCHVSHAVDRPG